MNDDNLNGQIALESFEAPAPEKKKKTNSAARRKKDRAEHIKIVPVTPEVPLQEDPIIIGSIKMAASAVNSGEAIVPAKVIRSIVTVESIEDMLSTAYIPSEEEDNSKASESAGGEKKNSLQTVTVSEDVLSDIASSTKLNAYDRAVLEAIYSQLMASPTSSNPVFSMRNLFRTMCGKQTGNLSMIETQKNDLIRSLIRLMSTVVAVEVSGIKADGSPVKVKKYLPLVPAEINEINIAGNITSSIRVTNYPPFLAYASYQKGISSTPLELLDIPINMTARNLAILNHLQHKLTNVLYSENAKAQRSAQEKEDELYIEYEPIYAIANLQPMTESKSVKGKTYSSTYCSRVREVSRGIVDNWKQKGFILDWAERRGAKNKTIGIEITLPPLPEDDDYVKIKDDTSD